MDGAVIYHSITRLSRAEDAFGYINVLGKNVEAERARPAIDPLDHGLDRTNLQHGQNRTKNFFPHDRRVRWDVHQHGRRDVQFIGICLTADRYFAAAKQPSDTDEVLAIRSLVRSPD